MIRRTLRQLFCVRCNQSLVSRSLDHILSFYARPGIERPSHPTWLTCFASREHPASEVYVTGTFDDWSKTEKLVKTGDVFEKDVTLPSAAEKIYYKVRNTTNTIPPSIGAGQYKLSMVIWSIHIKFTLNTYLPCDGMSSG